MFLPGFNFYSALFICLAGFMFQTVLAAPPEQYNFLPFDPGDHQALESTEIVELVGKGVWQGHSHSGSPIYQQFSGTNGVAIRTDTSMMSGSYHIENDKLCVTFRSVLLDLPDCGYIYPGTIPNEFTWVTLGDVYQFSIGH